MIRRTLTPESPPDDGPIQQRRKNRLNILFLFLTPVIGIFGTLAYAIACGVASWEPALFFTLFGLVSFSVTAGNPPCEARATLTTASPEGIST